ncbi:MAG: CoA transferase [Burkholderiales bacterium]|nr:CoA transferase [Burkholderiales bacterium]
MPGRPEAAAAHGAGTLAGHAVLAGLVAVELGERLAVGLCGALLHRLGAEVWVVEAPGGEPHPEAGAAHRALLGAGKYSIEGKEDERGVAALLERADVVITSSDWRAAIHAALAGSFEDRAGIVCDVSAFGTSGPLAGERHTDAMMQAFAGLMDTTGMPDGPPVASRVPILECSAAVFAAAGVLAALRSRRTCTQEHRVEVALFDTAVSMMSTFLPAYFTGGSPRRIGNRHPSMSPWNAYAARDGWVLLCSASDDMWGRVCEAIARPELRADPRFARMAGRVQNADAADAAIEPWIAAHSVAECLDAFNAASVPCGPVHTIAEVLADSSLHARGAFCTVADTASGKRTIVPGRLIHAAPPQSRLSEGVTSSPRPREKEAGIRPSAVLSGIRVVEMGNYTTAPLAARNLGALGAYVVKAEPPSGELSRASPPYRDGQSYLCTISNSDKRSVAVDLREAEGRALFHELLSHADVFVENMKPGALARFGFARDEIMRLNPRLVYCSVSGYGANSPLAERPAMDATIQGSAGIMDLTRGEGVPFKTGVSISDLVGGQFSLLAILAGLEHREHSDEGWFIDLSMQELSAWLTQFFWNAPDATGPTGRVLRCNDGHVYVAGGGDMDRACADIGGKSRAEAVSMLAAKGLRCVPVHSVSEVAAHAQTAARELIVHRPSANGKTWPLLACPIRLNPFPAAVRRALGGVGEDLDEVVRDWGLRTNAGTVKTAG